MERQKTLLALGMELAQWRRAASVSQETIAAACGAHRNTVSRWESGELEIGVADYLLYCEAIGLSWRRTLFEIQRDQSFTVKMLEKERNQALEGIDRERDPWDKKKAMGERKARLRELLAERIA